MTDRIIAVNSNCYHGYSIEEAIAGIRAAGFHYIELTATKGWTEHVFPDQSFQRLLEVKDKLDEAGLIPFAMSGHTNLMDTARIPDFVKNIRLAHFFGARYIVSSIGEAHLKDNAVASNAVVAEHIRGFLPYLEKYDMILVLEVHGDHGTGAILKEIVNLVGSDRVRINYDTANAIFYGDVDVVQDLGACMDRVGADDNLTARLLYQRQQLGDERLRLGTVFIHFPVPGDHHPAFCFIHILFLLG